MSEEEYMKLMNDMLSKSKEEINEIFSTGAFNEIVLGTIVITMQNFNYSKKAIEEVVNECKDGTFDLYTAGQCRQAYKELDNQ